jgi:hypothetical protein
LTDNDDDIPLLPTPAAADGHRGDPARKPRPWFPSRPIAQFETLRSTIYKNSNSPGHLQPLNQINSGSLILIAVHYYAPPQVENQLKTALGHGEPFWYGDRH